MGERRGEMREGGGRQRGREEDGTKLQDAEDNGDQAAGQINDRVPEVHMQWKKNKNGEDGGGES